jgi:hypothetical protein
MVLTNYARQRILYSLGSELSNNYISAFAVGMGSETIGSNMTTLTGSEFSRFMITGSPDFSTAYSVTFTGDLNSVQASGLILKQYGNFASGPINTGSLWGINQLTGSLVCDGTIELRFETSFSIQ